MTIGTETIELLCSFFVGIAGLTIVCLAFRPVSRTSLRSQKRALRLLLAAIGVFALQELLGGADMLFGGFLPETGFGLVKEGTEITLVLCAGLAFYLLRESEYQEVSRLHRWANVDFLTGLNNYSYFCRAAYRRVELAATHTLPLSCLMVDVDDFKAYNDAFGHEAGNAVLVRIAGVLRECTRADELLARYGGEEFVLLVGGDLKAATELAERIRSEVEVRCAPEQDPSLPHRVTVSVGVAQLAEENEDLKELIDKADRELYRAKNAGKNRVTTRL